MPGVRAHVQFAHLAGLAALLVLTNCQPTSDPGPGPRRTLIEREALAHQQATAAARPTSTATLVPTVVPTATAVPTPEPTATAAPTGTPVTLPVTQPAGGGPLLTRAA